ncbi:GSCOCG00009627001-RA-CDS, partial [Cotesia congregata]
MRILVKVLLVMAACLPFCCASSVRDSTLYLEVWRSVWRFADESYTNGIYVNRFYHCVGTPITSNVILTSAKCISRFYLSKNKPDIYLYGGYNQTETMIDRTSPFFVHFMVNEIQSLKEYSPMVFEVRQVFRPEVSDTDIAYLVLKDPIYLDKGLEFVKLVDNDRNRVYNNCTMVSANRSNTKRSINLTCNFTSNDNSDHLRCHPVNNPHDLRVFFDPGSPIFCEENNSTGFV